MVYKPILDVPDTEQAIEALKCSFQQELASRLHLKRVSAPQFLPYGTGLQDDLAGTQEPVSFRVAFRPEKIEMVHSLAKWKRFKLAEYGYQVVGTGIWTDMNALRKDEKVDDIHSVYVDQWDWEQVITPQQRTLGYLQSIVGQIYGAMKATEVAVHKAFPALVPTLPDRITFVHTEDLEQQYRQLSPDRREYEIARKHGAVFLIGIGHPLRNGLPHDARAVDYDDWITPTSDSKHGLNGDIIVWDTVRRKQLELSSMGIRVDAESLRAQTRMKRLEDRLELPFHKGVLDGSLPLTVGGGIGQSRLSMLLLQKMHIGEVQVGVWPDEILEDYRRKGVRFL